MATCGSDWVRKTRDGWLGSFGSRRYETTIELQRPLDGLPEDISEDRTHGLLRLRVNHGPVFAPCEVRPPAKKPPVSLSIGKGYRFDGPSGPTLDTGLNMEPSLWHDAGYGLIDASVLSRACRAYFDRLFYRDMMALRQHPGPLPSYYGSAWGLARDVGNYLGGCLRYGWQTTRCAYHYAGVRVAGGAPRSTVMAVTAVAKRLWHGVFG